MRIRNLISASAILCASLYAQSVDPTFLATLMERHKPQAETFSFSLIGDQHYGAEGIRKWPALATSMNADTSLRFIVHNGDIKNGSTLCDDATFASRFADFNNLEAPFIYTPGDNEWTDCHRANNGSYNSLERLREIRRLGFPDEFSLGKRKMRLSRQSEVPGQSLYRENAIWSMGNVVFATVHIVGSNNNLGRDAENDAEYKSRNEANLLWIRTAFALARDNAFSGIMIIIQANPNFELGPQSPERTGFNSSLYVLDQETVVFKRPVILVHGDSHYFRIDKPFYSSKSARMLENFTRVETFGSTEAHWLKATVNASGANLFSFEPVMVPANLVEHPIP